MDSRQLGRYKISHALLEDEPRTALHITRHTIPVRAEYLYAENCIEYVALSDNFRKLAIGGIPPYYNVIIRHNDEGGVAEITFEEEA